MLQIMVKGHITYLVNHALCKETVNYCPTYYRDIQAKLLKRKNTKINTHRRKCYFFSSLMRMV